VCRSRRLYRYRDVYMSRAISASKHVLMGEHTERQRMSHDLSRFAINQITTPKWTMPEALEGYKRQGISGIAVWRQFLEEYGVAQTRKHLGQLEMWVPSLCTSEWLNVSVDQSMTTAIDTNRRLLDAAAEIGAACLMMVVGGMPPDSKDIAGQRARVRDALFTLLPHAREVGVKLGLEPLHPMYAGDRSVLNSIKVASSAKARVSFPTCTTAGGTPPSRRSFAARVRSASSPSTIATGSCRRGTCATAAWLATA